MPTIVLYSGFMSRNILVTITHSSTDNTGLYNVSTSELRMMRQRRFSVVFTLLLQHLQSYLNLPSSITISSIWPTSSSTSRCAFRGRYKVANTEFHTFAVSFFLKIPRVLFTDYVDGTSKPPIYIRKHSESMTTDAMLFDRQLPSALSRNPYK